MTARIYLPEDVTLGTLNKFIVLTASSGTTRYYEVRRVPMELHEMPMFTIPEKFSFDFKQMINTWHNNYIAKNGNFRLETAEGQDTKARTLRINLTVEMLKDFLHQASATGWHITPITEGKYSVSR